MLASLLLVAFIGSPPPAQGPAGFVMPPPSILADPIVVGLYDPCELAADKSTWVFPPDSKLKTRTYGSTVAVWGPPGVHTAIELTNDKKPHATWRTITIGDVPPGPNPPGPPTPPTPPPNPPGPPTPPQPPGPGKYGVAPLVFDLASKLPANAKTRAPALAAAFRRMSTAITILNFKSETERALAEAEPYRDAWKAVENPLGVRLETLNKTKVISTIGDLRVAYAEIADGLERVR